MRLNKFNISGIAVLWSIILCAQQGGGMWIPNELNEKEMKKMGLKLSAKEIFSNQLPAINNAVAHFGGGCTSEVISEQGLLLTNHHCGYGQIQAHSTLEHDYLKDGFWAKELKDELPNPGLTATFILDIKEVTTQVLDGVKTNEAEETRQEKVKQNIKNIIANYKKEDWQEVEVKPFYKGNKYYLFLKETYKDVRLVGAPPSSIGKFGSDTDNWVWPRHTGDFSMFRIYADKNNKPAEYSKDNVPYRPKHSLPVKVSGVEQGDFTFVYGFPGRTNEYLPASALEMITQKLNPAKIKLRDETLKIMDKYMKKEAKTKIQYASKYARIANYWKKWIGENQGIEQAKAIQKKKEYEKKFSQRVAKKCMMERSERCVQYPQLLPDLDKLYAELTPYEFASDYFDEAIYRNSETFRIALLMSNLLNKKGEEQEVYYSRIKPYLKNLYKNYNPKVDKEVSLKMWQLYKENMESRFLPQGVDISKEDLDKSVLTAGELINKENLVKDTDKAMADKTKFISVIAQDPVVKKIGAVVTSYEKGVSFAKKKIDAKINNKLRAYMKAQLELMKGEKTFFPDANSTLRVTYGEVKGYSPRDAVQYEDKTHLKGVMEKYVPGDYEFDVPAKLQELYKTKNYGDYGEEGKMPIDFIATNHTTGGNSGSPALDAEGNLIGLNFDRVWEGTMSDLYYDPEICRNIMVDVRYILFIIDKYAEADRLIKEMKIVK